MGVDFYVYPMGLISDVAFSWGVLLLFADRKPIERRWILIPTILVVVLLGIVVVHAGLTQLIPSTRILPTSIAISIIFSILIYSYMKARDLR